MAQNYIKKNQLFLTSPCSSKSWVEKQESTSLSCHILETAFRNKFADLKLKFLGKFTKYLNTQAFINKLALRFVS